MKLLTTLLVLTALRAHACGTPARHVAESDDIYLVRTHPWGALYAGPGQVKSVLLTLKGRPIQSTVYGTGPNGRWGDLPGGTLAVLFRGREPVRCSPHPRPRSLESCDTLRGRVRTTCRRRWHREAKAARVLPSAEYQTMPYLVPIERALPQVLILASTGPTDQVPMATFTVAVQDRETGLDGPLNRVDLLGTGPGLALFRLCTEASGCARLLVAELEGTPEVVLRLSY